MPNINWYSHQSAFENLFREAESRLTPAAIAQRYAESRAFYPPSKYARFVKRMEEINGTAQAGS